MKITLVHNSERSTSNWHLVEDLSLHVSVFDVPRGRPLETLYIKEIIILKDIIMTSLDVVAVVFGGDRRTGRERCRLLWRTSARGRQSLSAPRVRSINARPLPTGWVVKRSLPDPLKISLPPPSKSTRLQPKVHVPMVKMPFQW